MTTTPLVTLPEQYTPATLQHNQPVVSLPEGSVVIFDLDGVLVESEPLWQQGFADAANNFCAKNGLGNPGYTPQDMERFRGGRVNDTIATLITEQNGAHLLTNHARYHLTHDVIAAASAAFTPELAIGASVFTARDLAVAGVPLAVASSSALHFINAVLEGVGLNEVIDVRESALTLKDGKPHPEVYERALTFIEGDAELSVAIEDSLTGVLSAVRAGLNVIWLRTGTIEPNDPHMQKLVTALRDLNVPDAPTVAKRVQVATETLEVETVLNLLEKVAANVRIEIFASV